MKIFLIKIAVFMLFVILFVILGLVMPATPRASKSFYYYNMTKDSLLANVDSPRLIFLGGSNISFGLNSQIIKDSFNVNPINTGISASLGLKFMLDNTVQYIKKGDIIIAPLEYSHYTNNYNYCYEALLRMIFDVNRKYLRLLNLGQMFNLLQCVPSYSISKFKPNSYFDHDISTIDTTPYGRNSFNRYGDECAHWNMKN
jgi:hypothetical protein